MCRGIEEQKCVLSFLIFYTYFSLAKPLAKSLAKPLAVTKSFSKENNDVCLFVTCDLVAVTADLSSFKQQIDHVKMLYH